VTHQLREGQRVILDLFAMSPECREVYAGYGSGVVVGFHGGRTDLAGGRDMKIYTGTVTHVTEEILWTWLLRDVLRGAVELHNVTQKIPKNSPEE
jgi:hypothetical protein